MPNFKFERFFKWKLSSCYSRLVGAIIVLIHNETTSCTNGEELRIYLYGMVAALGIIILTDIIAIGHSGRGSIMDNDARKLVVPLVYLR